MESNFRKERRGPLKSTCTMVGATAITSVEGSLGCMLSSLDTPSKQFLCLSHDTLLDSLTVGVNTGGATSRTLPYIPLTAVDGKLVVADKFSGYVGVKRG